MHATNKESWISNDLSSRELIYNTFYFPNSFRLERSVRTVYTCPLARTHFSPHCPLTFFSDAVGSTDGRCVIRPPHQWCTIHPDDFFLIANPDTFCTLKVKQVDPQTSREEFASDVVPLDQMSTCPGLFNH